MKNKASEYISLKNVIIDQITVNEYTPGQGIAPHVG